MDCVNEYDVKPENGEAAEEPEVVTHKQTMSFGSQDKEKEQQESPSRLLKK